MSEHEDELPETGIAHFVRNLTQHRPDVAQQLYRLTPPLDGWDYVVVSAAFVSFTGIEVMVFPATPDGEWHTADLGCVRGTLDPVFALAELGYTVLEAEPLPRVRKQTWAEMGYPEHMWEQMDDLERKNQRVWDEFFNRPE